MTDWRRVPDDEVDARLSAALRDLADAAVDSAGWSRWQMLSEVRGRMQARGRPRRSSRLAPLAATGGLAALLVLLVVSAPAFTPGAATPSAEPTPPSSWSHLNTREFSEALAAGRLRGETVVVTGALDVLDAPCDMTEPCDRYSLAGVDPPLAVHFHALPAPEGEGEPAQVDGADWEWWEWPAEPPAGAPLVLAVTQDGLVDYVGWVSEQPMGINSFSLVDPASMAQSEVHVVPGWLAGLTGPLKSAPDATIAGLPQRSSGPPSWLLGQPVALDPQSYAPPPHGVELQAGAYLTQARDLPESPVSQPIPGLWAVAPRLEGGGCPGEERTCWQWNLVGRVSYQEADNVAEPTAGPTVEPSPTRADPLPTVSAPPVEAIECRRAGSLLPGTTPPPLGWTLAVEDAAALVMSCSLGARISGDDPDPIIVQSGYPPMGGLSIAWTGDSCRPTVLLRFERAGDGYLLQIEESVRVEGGPCQTEQQQRWVTLRLSEPIGDWQVTPVLNGETGPIASPSPVPVPGEGRLIECDWDDITVVDYEALIDWCTPLEVDAAPDEDVPPSNPDGDTRRLRIHWPVPDICGRMPSRVELRAGNVKPYSVTVVRDTAGDDPGCSPPQPGWRSMDLHLLEPVDAADVEFPVVQQVALRTAEPNPDNVCPGAEVRGTLVGHPESGVGLRMDDGRVRAVMWPHAYTARSTAEGVVLFRPDGSVAAREGDYILSGGAYHEEFIYACSEGDVAEPVAIWTATERCGLDAPVSGYLFPHAESGLGIQYTSLGSTASAVTWPTGYGARREHSEIVLVGPDGVTRAWEGDLVTFGGGGSPDGHILACGEVTTSRSP